MKYQILPVSNKKSGNAPGSSSVTTINTNNKNPMPMSIRERRE
jgi:hypothetical protein